MTIPFARCRLPEGLLAMLLVFAGAITATGCRTNLLPEYMPKIQTAQVVVFMADEPSVSIGNGQQTGAFGAVAGLGWAVEMQKRLQAALDAQVVATDLAASFEEQMKPSFGTTLVVDGKQPHDSAIHIDIQEFGVEAASVEDAAYYMLRADVRMVYVPENKLIWEYSTALHAPIRDIHISGTGLAAVIGAGLNLSALKDLDDEKLRLVFGGLAAEAGAEIVDQMRRDATN